MKIKTIKFQNFIYCLQLIKPCGVINFTKHEMWSNIMDLYHIILTQIRMKWNLKDLDQDYCLFLEIEQIYDFIQNLEIEYLNVQITENQITINHKIFECIEKRKKVNFDILETSLIYKNQFQISIQKIWKYFSTLKSETLIFFENQSNGYVIDEKNNNIFDLHTQLNLNENYIVFAVNFIRIMLQIVKKLQIHNAINLITFHVQYETPLKITYKNLYCDVISYIAPRIPFDEEKEEEIKIDLAEIRNKIITPKKLGSY